jgi:phosphohistidine phosphatase
MVKTLLLMRHAKSDWDRPDLDDRDRPLAPRGERDAPRMGAAIAALDMTPDSILSSTATRARDTARLAADAMRYDGTIREMRAIYAASADVLLAVLRDDAGADSVLLVGHNPGMEELVGLLIGGSARASSVRMPTAAVACLSLAIRDWRDVAPDAGTLHWLLTPRVVAPLIGAAKRR